MHWSASVVLLIDMICDKFEAALAAGEWPRIEEYSPKLADELQPVLFRELPAIEVEHRRPDGSEAVPRQEKPSVLERW